MHRETWLNLIFGGVRHKHVTNIPLCSQQRSQQTQQWWANTEPDSTNAWTRWPASCPLQRGWTRRWGRDSSATCPAAWVRWCPWTTRSRLRPSRRIWPSPSMSSSHPPCPSAPSSVPPRPSLLRCSVGFSWFPRQMGSSPSWSPTRPSLQPPPLLSSPSSPTPGCLLGWMAARCTAAPHRQQHLQCMGWRPSLGGPRWSARWGWMLARRTMKQCGGLGSSKGSREFRLLPETFTQLLRDSSCDFDGNFNQSSPPPVLIVSFYGTAVAKKQTKQKKPPVLFFFF